MYKHLYHSLPYLDKYWEWKYQMRISQVCNFLSKMEWISYLFSILSSGRIQTLDEISCMSKEHCITGSTTYHWQHCQPQISHTLRVIHILRNQIFRYFWLPSSLIFSNTRFWLGFAKKYIWNIIEEIVYRNRNFFTFFKVNFFNHISNMLLSKS